VRIEETGKNPDGPPSRTRRAYDSRLKSSMASALGFQGPLDGGWTLLAGERELYCPAADRPERFGRGRLARSAPAGRARTPPASSTRPNDRGDDLTLRFAGGAVVASCCTPTAAAGAAQLTEGRASHAVSLRPAQSPRGPARGPRRRRSHAARPRRR
jgi:hypothetical protein